MAATVYIDGLDVTSRVMEGSVTHQANAKSTATIRQPIPVASGGINSALEIRINGATDYFGRVAHVDEFGEDSHPGYVTFTAVDPLHILEYRIARDADGDYSKPSFMTDYPQGPQMIREILENSQTYEGSLGFTPGSFATGGVNLSGLATDWPMSISEIIGQLVQTGEVDLVWSPNSGGGVLSVENGRAGSLTSTELLYGMGSSSNCTACRRTIDATDIMNKFTILLGPRTGTNLSGSVIPNDGQHWAGNITRDHPELAGLPGGLGAQAFWASQISRQAYLERMEVRVLDADYATAYQLYLHWWVRESLLRAFPKVLVHMTPEPGVLPTFRVHDRIRVQRGGASGFSGIQRVYQYTYRLDGDGRFELGEPLGQAGAPAVVTSADQEVAA